MKGFLRQVANAVRSEDAESLSALLRIKAPADARHISWKPGTAAAARQLIPEGWEEVATGYARAQVSVCSGAFPQALEAQSDALV